MILYSSYGSSLWLERLVVRMFAWTVRGPVFESQPGHVFFSCDIWCVRVRAASSKGTVLSVPAWFRVDTGTNPINAPVICNHNISAIPASLRKSSEALADICQTDTFFFFFCRKEWKFAGQKKYSSRRRFGLSTDFSHQFATTLVLMYSESKRK